MTLLVNCYTLSKRPDNNNNNNNNNNLFGTRNVQENIVSIKIMNNMKTTSIESQDSREAVAYAPWCQLP